MVLSCSVQYASCYGNKQAVQLLGRNSYFSLFANPPCLISQRQRLACPAPEMTLRQITQLIRVLRQLNLRDAKGNQFAKLAKDAGQERNAGLDNLRHSYASCYGNKQAVQLLGRNSYFSLFANPPCLISQRQRLACPAPEMTLRQITQLIRVLRQLNLRDAKGNQFAK
ncbi:hypothetical protein lerEdw1_020713, partial [Lerista edwardsae]